MPGTAKKEKPLTEAQKKKIWDAILSKAGLDDKDPHSVIEEEYGGNEDAYLIAMAEYLGITL